MTTGKSKSDFPGAFIPFDLTAGLVPAVPIDSSPSSQICVSNDWLPFVVGCLKVLSRPETWDDTYDNAVIAASEFAALVGNIADGCGVSVPGKMCISGTFADLDYGWTPTSGAGCAATWVNGTGWVMCCDATPQGFLQIDREFGVETVIDSVYLKITNTPPFLINYDVTLFDRGDFVSVASDTGVGGPIIIIDVGGLNQRCTAIFLTVVEIFGGCASDTIVTDWKLCYTGPFPLSVNDAWERVYDFTIDDQGWTNDGFYGAYSAGVGWVDTTEYVSGENATYQGCGIKLTLASAIHPESITVEYDNTLGSNTVGGEGRYAYLYHTSGAPGNRLVTRIAEGGSAPIVYSGVPVTDTVYGFDNTDAYLVGNVVGDGATLITKITMRGHGVPPP